MIKITSDGTARGTRVTGPDGVELKGITKIEILPVLPGELVRAAITFSLVHLEIEAIRQAAEHYVEPPHPAEVTGFDTWMRERTGTAHAAYMARHAARRINFTLRKRAVGLGAHGALVTNSNSSFSREPAST